RAAFQALEGNDFVAVKIRADRAIQTGGARMPPLERGRLELVLAEASRWSGEHEAAREHAYAAMQALPPGAAEWYAASAEATEAAMILGHSHEARGIAERLLEIAAGKAPSPFVATGGALEQRPESAPDPEAGDAAPMTIARVVATSRVATVLGVAGLYDSASALLGPIERAEDFTETEHAARAFFEAANVARASWEGDLERAAISAQSAIVCFELVGDARNATRQRQNAGWALAELGAYKAAEVVLREARDAAERLGLAAVANDAKLRLGHLYSRTNRPEDAIQMTQEVIAAYAAQRDRIGEGRARAYLAGVHYLAGDNVAAEEEERRALPLVEHSPPYRAALMAFMALTLLHKGAPPDEIYSAGAEAMRRLEQVGGLAEGEALTRLAYAEALYAKGDLDAARAAIETARDRLLARAAKIKNPDFKHAFLHGVRENVRTFARAGEWLR
ncbi:MAG TPA: hypothetical protein VM925_18785, partial [Labilithrix sp.]|nr:hypothetical protein [Labilithrix sp.]